MNVRLFAALLIALFSLSVMTGCAPGNLEAQPTKQERLSQPEVGALTAQEAEAIASVRIKESRKASSFFMMLSSFHSWNYENEP